MSPRPQFSDGVTAVFNCPPAEHLARPNIFRTTRSDKEGALKKRVRDIFDESFESCAKAAIFINAPSAFSGAPASQDVLTAAHFIKQRQRYVHFYEYLPTQYVRRYAHLSVRCTL